MSTCISAWSTKITPLLTTVQKILGREEVPLLKPSCRIIGLYVCRFIGRREYRKRFRQLLKTHGASHLLQPFLDLKEELDYKIYKNRLLKGIHFLCGFKRKVGSRYASTATAVRVSEQDLRTFTQLLSREEQDELHSSRQFIPIHTPAGVEQIVTHVTPIIRSRVYKQLRFVTQYDGGIDFEDMVSALKEHAIVLIRRYEVNNPDETHLIKAVVRGLQNHVNNLASAYGRPKRRPIARTHKKDPGKVAWYFDRCKMVLKRVVVCDGLGYRTVDSRGRVLINVRVESIGKDRLVRLDRLFETKRDADQARHLYRTRGVQKRKVPFINLSVDDIDQFSFTNTSLLQEYGEYDSRLIDRIPAKVDDESFRQFVTDIGTESQCADLKRFAELIVSPTTDRLFSEWCAARNRNVSGLGPEQVGKLACRYLGLSMNDIRWMLLETAPSGLWSTDQRAFIEQQSTQF